MTIIKKILTTVLKYVVALRERILKAVFLFMLQHLPLLPV